jgi:hypothetical protein
MIEVGLHIFGAAAMMAVVFLGSTPWWLAWPWAVAVSLFWLVRELAQDRRKHGHWVSPAEWSGWKIAEAASPCLVAIGCAAGVTTWRAFW